MATDVSTRPKVIGDWKSKAILGLLLTIAGFAGLANAVPLGLELWVRWFASNTLLIGGLLVLMYALSSVT